MNPGRRPGIALPLVLFLILALSMLAGGLLLLAAQQIALAGARGDAVRARLAAGSAARAVLANWRTSEHRDLAAGASEPLAAAGASLPRGVTRFAAVRRLSESRYLIRGYGRVGPAGAAAARARVGLLIRVPELLRMLRAVPAALTVDGTVRVEDGAVVSSADPTAVPQGWPADSCPPDASRRLSAAFGRTSRPGILAPGVERVDIAPSAVVEGSPAVSTDLAPAGEKSLLRLGSLDAVILERIADRNARGEIRPSPRESGDECDLSAAANWGAPRDPASACGTYLPLIFAPGDLTINGGVGQGILVVTGDLTLTNNAEFHGIVLVQGRLETAPESSILGAARVGSFDAPSLLAGRVEYNACTIQRALGGSPALNRPFRPTGRWWMPVF